IPSLRSGFSEPAAANGVEGRDLRSPGLRTPSGPEGSSGKERTWGCRSHLGRSREPWHELGVLDRGEGARPLNCPMPEYQSLDSKYRAQTFGALFVQDAASRALQGAIISGRVAHAYLFSGSRGTGKTSVSCLLAKAVNCTGRPRDSAEPCNKCQSCLEMTSGSALDLIEIDAASNRGLGEIRDLREKVNLAPALGPYKIYIIDEAHMLTEPAFNALLKTLEAPAAHVGVVLSTTHAQKIPLTVIGRCQQFVFRRHTEDKIIGRLTHIAQAEKV